MSEKGKLRSALAKGAMVIVASASVTAAPLVVSADPYYLPGGGAGSAGSTAHVEGDCTPDDCDCDCGEGVFEKRRS